MNPQEKAKELIEKFKKIKRVHYVTKGKPLPTSEAKQCALICVEEIISSYEKTKEADRSLIPVYNYWKSVKEELTKK